MRHPQGGAGYSVLIASWLLTSTVLWGCGTGPSPPWTPLPAATAEPAPTVRAMLTRTPATATVATGQELPLEPSSSATPSPPATMSAATVGRIEAPPPPPLPQVFLESGERLYQGWRGSYCWPISANSSTCADSAGWRGFDEATTVRMKPGNGFRIVVAGDGSSLDQVRVATFTVLETRPVLTWGEEVYSTNSREVPALDLPVGVYFVATFLKFQVGDVFYGFKIEIAD